MADQLKYRSQEQLVWCHAAIDDASITDDFAADAVVVAVAEEESVIDGAAAADAAAAAAEVTFVVYSQNTDPTCS